MRRTTVRVAARIGILPAVMFALGSPGLGAQGPDTTFSVWLGGTTDRFEETLPVSPQLGVRLEVEAVHRLWIGLEATGLFVNERQSCPGLFGQECDDTALDVTPTVSGQVRVELGGDAVRPYVSGVIGRAIRGTNVSSTVLGGGAGVLFSERLRGKDLGLEVRYRSDDRFTSLDYDHWEFLVGLHL